MGKKSQQQKKTLQYDKWVTIESNANIRNASTNKSGGVSPNFVLIGRQWNRRIITYFFQNGTPDIAGTNEQIAVRDAMVIWSNAVDLFFLEVCNQAEADISFLFAAGNHGDPIPDCEPGIGAFDGVNGTLAHNMGGPDPGNNCGAQGADIHFDEAENWTDAIRANGDQPIDLVTVAAHELGHALGLFHTTVAGSLMEANYTGSHRFLGQDDLAGIRSIYGLPQTNIPVSGPVVVCTNGTFTVNNQPANTAVTWTTGNTNALTINLTNGIATRQNNFNGQVTVTATINSGCGLVNIPSVFWVGLPQVYGVTLNSTSCIGGSEFEASYSTTGSPGATFDVSIPPSPSYYVVYANAAGLYVSTSPNVFIPMDITPQSACGAGPVYAYGFYTNSCSYGGAFFSVSPNPASTELTVKYESVTDTSSSMQKKAPGQIESAILKDELGRIHAQSTDKSESIILGVSSVPNGIYYLHVSLDGKTEVRRVVIKK